MNEDRKDPWKSFTEEIEVSSQHLLEEIHRLIKEGNVRRLHISSAEGNVSVSLPLTAGAVAGGLVAISAPWLAILAAVAGLATRVKVEIVRNEEPGAAPEPEVGADPDKPVE